MHNCPSLPWLANGRFPLYLAPMAGFTDAAFRTLAKEQGADVLVSEFVHAKALLFGDGHYWKTIAFDEIQRPFGVQLFGDEPASMAQAARAVCERLNPDFIDLNFGCPSPRVTGSCAGSALLKDLPQLEKITSAAVNAVGDKIPVTAKTRLGWDSEHIVIDEVLDILQSSGARALVIHARTKAQRYRGHADWETIGRIADKATIPIIANGSITSAADIQAIRARYPKIAGAMIGRAAIGYPWIFSEIKAALRGEVPQPPDLQTRWNTLVRYAELALPRMHGPKPIRALHSALVKLTAGMPNSRTLRLKFNRLENLEQLKQLAREHLAAHQQEGDSLEKPDDRSHIENNFKN